MSVAALTSVERRCFNSVCNNHENATKKCSQCHTAIYCSKDCQVIDWPKHKSVCLLSKPKPADQQEKKSTFLPKDAAAFELFKAMANESNSEPALSEARKYAAEGKMNEASSFVSLMNTKDQDTFLSEMKGNKSWETVEVAVMLVRSNRKKEAMQIMEKFGPGEERDQFLAAVFPRSQFLSQYKTTISL